MKRRPISPQTPRMTPNSTSSRDPWPAAISIPLRFVYGIYAALLFLAVVLISPSGRPADADVEPAARHRPHRSKTLLPARRHAAAAARQGKPAGGPVRGGRQSRELPRRRGHGRGAAAALRLRDQARNERRAGRRPAAAPDRLGVRRPLQSAQGRHGCTSRVAHGRERPFTGVLSGRHVHAAKWASGNSTPARSRSRRAPPARWCRR